MGLGDFHRHRRLASAFAFVGVLLYTALIPGHLVSQATALALGGELGQALLEMPCHSGVADSQDPSAPGKPSTPQQKCPFCKGHAPFMTALAGICDTGELDAERVIARLIEVPDGHSEGALSHPNNRGPPLEPLMS